MTVRTEDDDGIRWLLLDRPEVHNALTVIDVEALRTGLTDLPDDVRVVVVRGCGGRAFSAGVDVAVFRDLTTDGAREFITGLGEMLAAARRCPVPTVAAVDGYCLGGAMELAAACDLRVVADSARFGMPEIRVGVPSVLDAALLPGHLGLSLAKEMILTGALYDVASLRASGFCNRVVPQPEVGLAAERLAREVSGHQPVTTAAQKRLFETWQNVGLDEAAAASVEEFAQVFDDPGVRAGFEGRRRD